MSFRHATTVAPLTIPRGTWENRRSAHEQRVDSLTADHRHRRVRGLRHPVWDFLFDYYRLSPTKMRRWHPGVGVTLQGECPHSAWKYYGTSPSGTAVNTAGFAADRGHLLRFIRELLTAENTNRARFNCFGMHEWAMVYRTDNPRHQLPLRLGAEGSARVVDHHAPLACTHVDAFRFYTPQARPLNERSLLREDQCRCEQRGCLHATMDLYKWAYSLLPLTSSELVVDCFELACDVRILDMEASPYDCRSLGFGVVAVETPEGKAEYVRRQREFARRADPLRNEILRLVNGALATTLDG